MDFYFELKDVMNTFLIEVIDLIFSLSSFEDLALVINYTKKHLKKII
jgi:hypothetical protein